jgi:carbon-monoxide dehydrogenase medium subunit
MRPAAFDYIAPRSLKETLALLAETPSAQLLAGGQELIGRLKTREIAPEMVVDLRNIAELSGIAALPDGKGWMIGARVTYAEIEGQRGLRDAAPALIEAARSVGDAQVRNWATVGGSLASARASGDLAAALVALGATIHLADVRHTRQVSIDQFYPGEHGPAIDAGTLIVGVALPALAPQSGSAYEKIKIPSSGYPLCGVSALVVRGRTGVVSQCRLAAAGVATRPVRLHAAEAVLEGHAPTPARIADAAAAASEGVECLTDLFASGEYRASLLGTLAERACQRALERSAQG